MMMHMTGTLMVLMGFLILLVGGILVAVRLVISHEFNDDHQAH